MIFKDAVESYLDFSVKIGCNGRKLGFMNKIRFTIMCFAYTYYRFKQIFLFYFMDGQAHLHTTRSKGTATF